MDKNAAWEIFAHTGKIEDYLNFKAVTSDANSLFDTSKVITNALPPSDKDGGTT